MLSGEQWFQGTADAVHQNINLIKEHRPDLVAVFGADHIYRMDVSQMVAFHKERGADVTIAALPVPLKDATSFGVIAADGDGCIREFQEKPSNPAPMPGNPEMAFASMGNYIFNADILLDALEEARKRGETDFGGHVLPRMLETHRLFSYDFATNEIPGIQPYEQRVYWRDVGSIDAYFDTHKDVLGAEPIFDMFNPNWPIFSSGYPGPVARILGGEVQNSLLGAATMIHPNTHIRNSIIRRESVIEEDVQIDDCIIMDYVRICKGSRLRRVIVDRHTRIEPGTSIGFDREADSRLYTVSENGVTVVPCGHASYYAREMPDGDRRGSYAE
jgi:glucose-1-phosphate adenylyltransferase